VANRIDLTEQLHTDEVGFPSLLDQVLFSRSLVQRG
jgi:hypothetical protein